MKLFYKRTIIFFIFFGFSAAMHAQSPQQIMNSIYEKYDSSNFLTFNVKFLYSTDTVGGNFNNEILDGSYTIAGSKAKYSLGNVEFLQNDSFFITVYNQEKIIMVTNPRSYNTGSDIPLRSNIDSLFTAYNKSYLITNTLTSGTGQIKFDRADSTAMYDKFYITYNDSTKHITTLEYQFKEPELTNDDDTTGAPPKYIMRKKILRVEFSSYRLDNFSPDSYNENNYIWFEEEECVPVEKFKGYKVYYSRSKL